MENDKSIDNNHMFYFLKEVNTERERDEERDGFLLSVDYCTP